MNKHQKTIILSAVLATSYAQQSSAGGFRIPESSIGGIALSNALVANPTLTDAFTYNYAAMGFHEGTIISLAGFGIAVDSSVTPGGPNAATGKVKNKSDDAVLPALYLMQQINNRWSWGLQAGVPFGLETVWPADTFSSFYTADTALGAGGSIAGLHPTDSELQLFNISPSIGLNLSDNLSVAVGLDHYTIKSVDVNSVGSRLKGDGNDLGWNLGVMYRNSAWTWGASFHSETEIDIKGSLSIIGSEKIAGRSQLTLPYRFQMGAHYQHSDKLAVEIDLERVGWHAHEKTVLRTEQGDILSTNTNNWTDNTNIRLGMTWQLNPKTQLLFGTGYSETPASEHYFDATIAGNDTYMMSMGVTRQLRYGWAIKAAYQYAWVKDRTVSGRDYITQIAGSGGSNVDPNGSDAYNGKYKGDAHMVGIGITKAF